MCVCLYIYIYVCVCVCVCVYMHSKLLQSCQTLSVYIYICVNVTKFQIYGIYMFYIVSSEFLSLSGSCSLFFLSFFFFNPSFS